MANNSPPNPGDDSAAVNNPQANGRAVSSPWTQVVRGGESESIVSSAAPPPTPGMPSAPVAVQGTVNNFSPDRSPTKAAAVVASSSSSSDGSAADAQLGHCDNGNAGKKAVWSKPSNGTVEAVSVIDTDNWPALSESAKASQKSSSSDSLKTLPEGSVSTPQGSGIASSSTQKQVGTGNSNPTTSANHTIPKGPKPARRGGGSSAGNTNTNGRFPQPNPAIAPVPELSSNSTARSGPALQDSSSRDRVGSQFHSGSDQSQQQQQQQQRSSFRRGNGSMHPRGDGSSHSRGDGSYHQNYGNRRDHDRGSHEWNSHQGFNGRDGNSQTPRGGTRGGMRPSQRGSNSFIPPPPMPMRPLVNPMVYSEIPPHFIYFPAPPDFRGMPIVAPMPPRGPAYIFPPPDLQLHTSIVNQIEYYFSNDNLVKDIYLRQNMDDQGWVPIKLIAGFKRVREATDNFKLVMDAVCASSVVEVQGDKVRKRGDWSKWVMPSPGQFSTVSSPRLFGRFGDDNVAANFEGMSLAEATKNQQDQLGGSNSKDHPSGGEGLG